MPVIHAESKRRDVTNRGYLEGRVFDVNGFASGARLSRLHRGARKLQTMIPTPGSWTFINAEDPELNWPRLARLEQTIGALLERLGEDSTSITQPTTHPSPTLPVAALSSNGTGTLSKSDYPSAPPVMVIRDLASDIGVKSPDTSSQVAGLDGLIAPDLALSLFTM